MLVEGWLASIECDEFFGSLYHKTVSSGKRNTIERAPWLLKLIADKCKATDISERAVEEER